MSKFIHSSVRLNASITQSMRFFIIEKEVDRWFGKVNCIENKIGGKYDLVFSFQNETWHNETVIRDKVFERSIKLDFSLPERYKNCFEDSIVEVNFMMGTSDTEYCTEIHVLHKGLIDNDEGKDFFTAFWQAKLDTLRKHFNGDWVIEDKDMVLSILKGSF